MKILWSRLVLEIVPKIQKRNRTEQYKMEAMSCGPYQWQMHMEQFFHEKQGGSIPDEHNSQPTDNVNERFLTVRLLESEEILIKQKRWKLLFG